MTLTSDCAPRADLVNAANLTVNDPSKELLPVIFLGFLSEIPYNHVAMKGHQACLGIDAQMKDADIAKAHQYLRIRANQIVIEEW